LEKKRAVSPILKEPLTTPWKILRDERPQSSSNKLAEEGDKGRRKSAMLGEWRMPRKKTKPCEEGPKSKKEGIPPPSLHRSLKNSARSSEESSAMKGSGTG